MSLSRGSRPWLAFASTRAVRGEQVAGDDHAMHFGRPIVDAKRAHVAVQALERQIARRAPRSANLDGPIDHAADRLGDEDLADRGFDAGLVALVELPGGL